jgi:hypothetical protein
VKVNSAPVTVPAGPDKLDLIDIELERLKTALLEIFGLSAKSFASRERYFTRSIQNRAVPLCPKDASEPYARPGRHLLPDPKLLETLIGNRLKRREHFGRALVADPAWDMLLDLAVARARFRRVSVSSLCIASGVPSTTALRWIRVLTEEGLIERQDDSQDRRRTFLSLTDKGVEKVASYFALINLPNCVPDPG